MLRLVRLPRTFSTLHTPEINQYAAGYSNMRNMVPKCVYMLSVLLSFDNSGGQFMCAGLFLKDFSG